MKGERGFQYNIIFSKRRTISITVSPNKGVIVKAPRRTSVAIIEKFVNEKSGWIIKTLEGFTSLKRIDKTDGYYDGDQVLLFGRNHTIKLLHSSGYYVRPGEGDVIEVGYPNDINPLLIKAMLEKWFRKVAKDELTLKFHELLDRYSSYNFKPSGFVVRMMKSRWGSCSSKGKIAISYDLIRLDMVYGEYVIVHELCHLTHHNHGKDYYKLLSELYPNWKKVRKELHEYIR